MKVKNICPNFKPYLSMRVVKLVCAREIVHHFIHSMAKTGLHGVTVPSQEILRHRHLKLK